MRVVSIIESTIDNPVLSIESFGVFEEQLSDDVVEQAEKLFREKAMENGANEDDVDIDIENGHYSTRDGYTVTIVWSYI